MIMNNANATIQRFRDECLDRFDKRFLAEVLDKNTFWKEVEKMQEHFTAEELYDLALEEVDGLQSNLNKTEYERKQIYLLVLLVGIVDLEKLPIVKEKSRIPGVATIPTIFVKANCLKDNLSEKDKALYKKEVEKLTTSLNAPERRR